MRQLSSGSSLFPLEVSAADDHGLSVPSERRHGAEGKVAAIAVGVDAGATHAAFRLMSHRRPPVEVVTSSHSAASFSRFCVVGLKPQCRGTFMLMAFRVRLERTVPEPIRFPVSPYGVGVLTFTPIVGAAADTPDVTHAGALAVRKLTGFVFVDPRTAVNCWMQLDKSFAELLLDAGLHRRGPL